MDTKEIVIDNPVTVAGITLIPVAKVSLSHWHGNRGTSFFGFKQPIGVVVVSPSARRAFRITGEKVSLDQFIQEVPGIKEILEGI
ncbi:hypothetical protein ACFLWG_03875 [Chloroflexota bacterium]